MLKSKVLIKFLVIVTILFWFHTIKNSIAGSCDENASGGGTSTFTGNFNIPQNFECPENPSLEYDTVNSAETIDRNGSAALVVIGNNGPYTWSVSGTGFSLEIEGQPTGPTNTLHADGAACGAATITVTGCSGPPVTGYVRCTTGRWIDITQVNPCPSPGGGVRQSCSCAPNWTCGYQKISGKYKIIQGYALDQYCNFQTGNTYCLDYNCEFICNSGWERISDFRCYNEAAQRTVCVHEFNLRSYEWTCE